MTDSSDFLHFNGGRPKTMAALAVGNEVYFSSSIAGVPKQNSAGGPVSNGFLYDLVDPAGLEHQPKIHHMLDACAATKVKNIPEPSRLHRTKARCAEPMAIHQYYLVHPNEDFEGKNARIVTVAKFDGSNVKVVQPCGLGVTPPNWACSQLMDFRSGQSLTTKSPSTTTMSSQKGHVK